MPSDPEIEVVEAPEEESPASDPTPGAFAEETPAPPHAAPADLQPSPQPEHVPSPRRVAQE